MGDSQVIWYELPIRQSEGRDFVADAVWPVTNDLAEKKWAAIVRDHDEQYEYTWRHDFLNREGETIEVTRVSEGDVLRLNSSGDPVFFEVIERNDDTMIVEWIVADRAKTSVAGE